QARSSPCVAISTPSSVLPTTGLYRPCARRRERASEAENPGVSTYSLFALISGPVIGMVAPRLLPVFLLIQMIPLNGYVTWRERHALDGAGTTWISLGRLAGTFGGLGVLILVSEQRLSLLVGVSTVLAVLMTLLAPSFEPGKWAFLTAGLV